MTEAQIYYLTLGTMIARLRQRRGLSQAQLGGAAQLSQATISRLERGVGSPTSYELRQLAEALGLTLASLLAAAEDAMQRGDAAVRAIVGELGDVPWWSRVYELAGRGGAAGVVRFVVACVVAEREAPP